MTTDTQTTEGPAHAQETTTPNINWQATHINPQAPNAKPTAFGSTEPDSIAADQAQEETTEEKENDQEGQEQVQDETSKPEGESTENKQEEPPKRERLAKTLNEIARAQAQLRREKKELEEAKKQISGSSIDDLKSKAKESPLEALEALGLDYNSITEHVLNSDDKDAQSANKQLMKKIDALQARLEEKEKTDAQREEERKIEAFKANVSSALKSNEYSDKYELINAHEEYDTVVEVIRKYHEEYGRMLSLDEAADIVEDSLENTLQAQLNKLSKTQKWKKWGIGSQKESAETKSTTNETTPEVVTDEAHEDESTQLAKNFVRSAGRSPKTITGQMVGQSTSIRKAPRSREERILEAAKMVDTVRTD